MTDPLAALREDFMAWLFRDGGLEPPRRDWDSVDLHLRDLLDRAAGVTLAAPAECMARPGEPCSDPVNHHRPAAPAEVCCSMCGLPGWGHDEGDQP